jgi:hypothetical protein
MREEQNGIKRPINGICATIWNYLDNNPNTTSKDIKTLAESNGWNVSNAVTELYSWRKFHNMTGKNYISGGIDIKQPSTPKIPKEKIEVGPRQFGIGWFGSQQRFYDAIKSLVDTPKYIDITAGGSGVPYRLLAGKSVTSVITNDLSYYSYCCAKSVFEGYTRTDAEMIDLLEVIPTTGYLSNKPNGTVFGHFNDKVKAYIDGYCIKHAGNEFAMAALGKFLLAKCTFRGLAFSKTTASKEVVFDFTVQDIKNHILHTMVYFNNMVLGGGKAFNLNANDFVEQYNEFQDATVYSDPAWPWDPKQGDSQNNPYLLSSEIIPSILKQEDTSLRLPWNDRDVFSKEKTKGDFEVTKQKVIKDVTLWIDTVLSKGAKQFIINTQSTNYPNEEELGNILEKYQFTLTNRENLKGTGKVGFKESWFKITGYK